MMIPAVCVTKVLKLLHLALQCSFAKEVWFQFQSTYTRMVQIVSSSSSIRAWWSKISRRPKDENAKREATVALYIVWHIGRNEVDVFFKT